MIKVRYIYSACIVTETPDVKILHDPWFTEGIYDGSWFHFPTVDNPIESIGDVDVIYISHIHPDHYDPNFLHHYFDWYGKKPIIIADHKINYLAGKMKADGFSPEIVQWLKFGGDTEVKIMPHITGNADDIDSMIAVQHGGHCVLNTNDVFFNDSRHVDQLKDYVGSVDILLCGYTGAGNWPQTCFDIEDTGLPLLVSQKKLEYFELYNLLTKTMDAKVNIPFAGKYLLGGKLTHLNEFRGNADPVEILAIDPKAVVLADNGGEISTDTLIPSEVRTEPYKAVDIEKRLLEISTAKMDYERLISMDEVYQLPIKRVLRRAFANAAEKSSVEGDYFFWIPLSDTEAALINANKDNPSLTICDRDDEIPEPFRCIFIDSRYLFGLLTNIYHWNNADVGSQYYSCLSSQYADYKAQTFLHFLTV